jgi:hypothetical protein
MQIYVEDVFVTNFSRLTCYDTVSWYDTTLTSLLINYGATSAFYMHIMYDTSYDISIVSSLRKSTVNFRFMEIIWHEKLWCMYMCRYAH